MRLLYFAMLVATLAGCGPEEVKKPNPLEKADVPLPVLTMPLGHFPPKAEKPARPLLKLKLIGGKEVAVEGLLEVADPETFQPAKIHIKFLVERNGQRITAGTHRGGMPVRGEGNQYRYRSAAKVPVKPRRYVLEVSLVNGDLILVTSAEVQVVEAKKEIAKK